MISVSQGRLPDRRPLSIVDIGSNSIRLVIYEGTARSPTILFNEKMLAGLGRGIYSTGKLDPKAVDMALEEFRRFRALSEQAGAQSLHVIATAAAREAENGPDFIRRAEDVFRVPIRVLTGREEATYAGLGIISAFHDPDGISGDLGGGSLELVDIKGEEIGEGITLPLGGLRLQEMAKGSTSRAMSIARTELKRASFLEEGKGRTFYCVGGTWRNLARLHMTSQGYPLDVMHHYEFELDKLGSFLRQVIDGDISRMKGVERISKSRRALLPYGAAVLREIVQAMKPGKVVVSALGVREGYLYSLLDEQQKRQDPLISAAEELAILRARSVTHCRELEAWTGEAFEAFGIEETVEEARYRRAACLLTDIGWRAHPDYRGTQSLNIIAHGSFIGVDHPGRAFIALTSLFRHEGIYEDDVSPVMRSLAGPLYLERARILGALLRVVYLFSASMPGIIPKLKWRKGEGRKLSLVIPKSHADLMGERPDKRMALLGKVLNRPMDIVVADD
ncbi:MULTISPECIES: exopolyphosphatase [unclassified Aminobacter]|uniref:exopolyphosphatase n=1 Tax=unclassified Aminobacter TaxID=2644704 RepID=UPI0004648E7B|nr:MULTISPECIES: exopolyphosphatase [unclassified Aminobacter]TWH35538.1 exopolyphosphatase/guanosine-5'-triphosphate,3'-diphosphate pyrophosphatase [Aminobacter sp. J15]